MNFNQFINQPIINKDEERGIVISCDGTYITIKYKDRETTYNTNTAFSNKYLTFLDSKLNAIINDCVNAEEKEKLEKKRRNERIAIAHKNNLKNINITFQSLSDKNSIMLYLFGRDFKYPPYVEFMKKYKNVINVPVHEVVYELKSREKYR